MAAASVSRCPCDLSLSLSPFLAEKRVTTTTPPLLLLELKLLLLLELQTVSLHTHSAIVSDSFFSLISSLLICTDIPRIGRSFSHLRLGFS